MVVRWEKIGMRRRMQLWNRCDKKNATEEMEIKVKRDMEKKTAEKQMGRWEMEMRKHRDQKKEAEKHK